MAILNLIKIKFEKVFKNLLKFFWSCNTTRQDIKNFELCMKIQAALVIDGEYVWRKYGK